MISESNQIAIQAAGLSFILGTRIPFLPDVVREWRDKHPGEELPDGHVLTQPWPATSSEKARGIPDRVVYYQYRHDRARRTLRGIAALAVTHWIEHQTVGASRNSYALHGATAPSRSKPAARSSLTPTPTDDLSEALTKINTEH